MDTPSDPPPRGVRDLRVDSALRPGWSTGEERLPGPGERVLTHEGPARVVRVVGKTGKGGSLLELAIDDGRKAPFFAAAANVLVPPPGDEPEESEPVWL